MNRTQKILQNVSQKLVLPTEIVAGLPFITLKGFSEISVDKHKGILAYDETCVVIGLNIGKIRITGKELTIILMNAEHIILGGVITQVEMTNGEVL